MSELGSGRSGRADVVIVGGGSAGSVLANRLSEDPTRSVLLLEAGTAYGVDGYPDDLRDPHSCRPTPSTNGATRPAVELPPRRSMPLAPRYWAAARPNNATVAMRARPSDIRDWQRRDLDDWTLEDVYTTCREMENTPDGYDAYHGRTGPFPIRTRYPHDATSIAGLRQLAQTAELAADERRDLLGDTAARLIPRLRESQHV